jgi:hypothetical protein
MYPLPDATQVMANCIALALLAEKMPDSFNPTVWKQPMRVTARLGRRAAAVKTMSPEGP